MAGRVYNFENPERFVAGAIGPAGSRIFYLQARDAGRLVSVVLEKVQVTLLAERLKELLGDVRQGGAGVPEEPAADEIDTAPLEEPIDEIFRVGAMAIVWDGEEETIIVEAREMTEQDEELETTAETDEGDEDDSDVVRVRLRPAQALAFSQRALEVVAAGRPPCPFCGQPLNPEGHICARRNGFMH
ncbi:MAG: DUF3090 domain-containing protein [Candidatus Limnocylindrales bacterium]